MQPVILPAGPQGKKQTEDTMKGFPEITRCQDKKPAEKTDIDLE